MTNNPILIDEGIENADWIKPKLQLEESEEEATVSSEGETLFQKVKAGLKHLFSLAGGQKEEVADDTKANYQVQPFHANFGLEENKPWSFSASDGNAIIEKGGWSLFKQCHLVVDTSDGETPEKKDAYTYPVAKLVAGKPTYFLRSAQTVYAGLRGGARGADLPSATNKSALGTIKKIYKAFGKDTEQMETKSVRFITKDGRVIPIGGPGSGGGSVSGMSPIVELKFEAAGNAAVNLGYKDVLDTRIDSPEQIAERVISRYIQDNQVSQNEAKDVWKDEYMAALEEAAFSEKEYAGNTTRAILQDRMFAFKATDGSDWWLQFTTNSFTDREGENFQHKAIESFVDRHRSDDVKGEFWYRHVPGTKFGDVKWQAMAGRFLVQAGPFDDTKVGQAFKSFFQKYPNGHPEIAPNGWGTSHGYSYDAKDRDDKVYEWLEIKESTVLPLDAASNPWSPAPRIVKRGAKMNAQERKDLERIGGKELVDLVEREGERKTKELEAAGVGYKSVPTAVEKLTAMIEAVQDEAIRSGLQEILNELSQDTESEMEDEMEMAEAAVGKPKPGCKEAEPVKPESEQKPEPEVTEKKEAVNPDAVTKKEVAETIAGLATQLREEIKAANVETLKGITETIAPLVTMVSELNRRDAEKIAQKAASTPAASLREMVESALDSKRAAVKADDPLLGNKPAETPIQPRPEGGLPTFLSQLISGK